MPAGYTVALELKLNSGVAIVIKQAVEAYCDNGERLVTVDKELNRILRW